MRTYDPLRKSLFKYRKFDERTLSMFINRELYFASPANLNDPHDCQISISAAILEAVNLAHSGKIHFNLEKLDIIEQLLDSVIKIEADIKVAGIYSASKSCNNMLMWSHYANEHKGLCIGFRFTDEFLFGHDDNIYETDACIYISKNPFTKMLQDMSQSDKPLSWEDLSSKVYTIGLLAKHNAWKYEQEVRILRRKPGSASFKASEVAEVIFGLKMPPKDRKTLLTLLSSPDWSHTKFSEMTKKEGSFGLQKTPITFRDKLLPFTMPF